MEGGSHKVTNAEGKCGVATAPVDYMKILAANAWALIPVNDHHGDDASIMWVVVGYFMGDKPERVIGECWDEDHPHLAIEDALKTIKDNSYAYKYEYKHRS